MSLHLHLRQDTNKHDQLQLLSADESGSLTLWEYTGDLEQPSTNGNGWNKIWNMKGHLEAGKTIAI
jgi:hypothetical protein